jgi:hypothetical protein
MCLSRQQPIYRLAKLLRLSSAHVLTAPVSPGLRKPFPHEQGKIQGSLLFRPGWSTGLFVPKMKEIELLGGNTAHDRTGKYQDDSLLLSLLELDVYAGRDRRVPAKAKQGPV